MAEAIAVALPSRRLSFGDSEYSLLLDIDAIKNTSDPNPQDLPAAPGASDGERGGRGRGGGRDRDGEGEGEREGERESLGRQAAVSPTGLD
jgi:hypothetical protein